MKQLLLFDTDDTLAVGDHVRITNNDTMVGIPEGTKGVIIRIHPDRGCTVRWDDYTPTRSTISQKHEYACYREALVKLPFSEVRARQLEAAILQLNSLQDDYPF